MERLRQRKRIVEACREGNRTFRHGLRSFVIAGKGHGKGQERMTAGAGVMFAIARSHGLMKLRIVEGEACLHMRARVRRLTAPKLCGPCGVMSLKLEPRVAG